MTGIPHAPAETRGTSVEDEYLFGWDATPGIVSVWTQRDGRALVWRRDGERVICECEVFRPWLFATTLDDPAHAGAALVPESAAEVERAPFTYRELDGPEGSYRFLVTASSGRVLERALLHGAARRLRRPVPSLYDLDEQYYWLGPVEQYLMSSGRTFFRDLAYDDLHRLQFDLETTALDPWHGRIFMVAVRDSHGWSTTLEARDAADEPGLIARLCALIRERDPDVIENHNLHGFDLPFLVERARLLRVPLALGRPEAPPIMERYADPRRRGAGRREHMRISVPGREMIDTLDAVLRYDFGARDLPGYRLKEVARYFGVASPDRVYLAGETIYETYRRGPPPVPRSALGDGTPGGGRSLGGPCAPFLLAGMAPRRYERLASAGPAMGILEPMLVRAYLRAGAALPAYGESHAGDEEAHLGGAVHLFAEGVAEQVVKADIASLYPSLMRTFQIGPACDRLGVVLSIVDRLTDLRLAHKAAARCAAPGSLEAGHHAA